MTDAGLLACAHAALAKWQPRLHLEGWRIFLEIGDVADHEGAHLATDWRARASVLVLPPDHGERLRKNCRWHNHESEMDSVENSVVHELLHVIEWPVAGSFEQEMEGHVGDNGIVGSACRDLWRDYREWWIDHLARVLIEADRSGGWS